MIPQMKLYNPLNGEEFKTYLLDRFRQMLEDDQLLNNSNSFPLVTYGLTVSYNVFPMGDGRGTEGKDVTWHEARQLAQEVEKSFAVGAPISRRLEEIRTIGDVEETAPDTLRENLRLPTREARPGPLGMEEVESIEPRFAPEDPVLKDGRYAGSEEIAPLRDREDKALNIVETPAGTEGGEKETAAVGASSKSKRAPARAKVVDEDVEIKFNE